MDDPSPRPEAADPTAVTLAEGGAALGVTAPEPAVSPGEPQPPDGPTDVTALLGRARSGDRAAADALFARLYDQLHGLARAQLISRGRPGATLDTTALVHEAYLRLAEPAALTAEDRGHFFNLAARVMRHVIVDFARRRDADKRGGGARRVDLAEAGELADPDRGLSAELLALDGALAELERMSPDLGRLVELRFFAGLPLEEIALLTGRSERSLKRDWRRARAFLLARLGQGLAAAPATGFADPRG
jgi:RNA polymerase sigma factor (TIGR02999 family)